MIFCVFLDPESVCKLASMGGLGADALIGILRVLLGNCLLAETTDWRTGPELREAVRKIANQDVRARVSALLEAFWRRSRFVAILEHEEGDEDVSTAAVALRNRSNTYLDAIIAETPGPFPAGRAELTQAESFHGSDFAARCQQAGCGLALAEGAIQPADFFTNHLSRLLLVEGKFEIYDRVAGRDFGPNFFHNLPFWVDFLKQAEHDIEVAIHTEGRQTQPIQKHLEDLCDDTQIAPTVVRHEDDSLPHERYLKTPAFILNLGRGIDLFDPRTRKNRDLHITFSPRLALP